MSSMKAMLGECSSGEQSVDSSLESLVDVVVSGSAMGTGEVLSTSHSCVTIDVDKDDEGGEGDKGDTAAGGDLFKVL